MGFEALAAYALNEKNRFIYQMEITIESTYVPEWSYNVSFSSENFAQAHHIEVYFSFWIKSHSLNKNAYQHCVAPLLLAWTKQLILSIH